MSELLPRWRSLSPPLRNRAFRRCDAFICPRNCVPRTVMFSALTALTFVGLICYMTAYDLVSVFTSNTNPVSVFTSNKNPVSVITSTQHAFPSPVSSTEIPPRLPPFWQAAEGLPLEQIRDIVAPTRGFFSRDYSLYLGWNNVSIRGLRLERN
jgi:hypothetical protein